jgi:hypothetical protein
MLPNYRLMLTARLFSVGARSLAGALGRFLMESSLKHNGLNSETEGVNA